MTNFTRKKRNMRVFFYFASIFLAVVFVSTASGQALTGEIDGRVLDSSGASVAGVIVVVRNDDEIA